MLGSEEKISGPVINTSARPARVQGKVSFYKSAADCFSNPRPSSLTFTMVMVPIPTANPRMCSTSHTGNAHSFVFRGLFAASYARKRAITHST